MFKFFEGKKWLTSVVTVIIAAIIFYISSLSFKGVSTGALSLFYHFLAFFWFAFFLSITLISGKRKNLFVVAIILAIIYAISDEVHQFFVPFRNASISDILIDSFGILFFNFIYLLSFRKHGD